MALAPGTRIGPYEITATIGAGGMGEVYRALDTTLDRDVAIKILPELLAADPERVARFSREAKTLASLNHQNIAHIHGVVESPFALVMEFVEGEDLSQRLAQGPVPLDEVIPIGKQIADALECAHEQGIVHRDLKPANVKVRPDGTVKVLDFGLAKALSAQPEGAASSSALLLSPTFTSPAMTQMGMILGTAAYMSPEQARGKAVDKRADVWAFGVVLFEMLSGTRAFEGSEVSDTLAFVLTREPDWKALPADTPAPIRRLLRRCLHKDRKQRLADIADARIELDEALSPIAAEGPATVGKTPVSRWGKAALPAAVVIGTLLGLTAGWKLFTPAPVPSQVSRFVLTLPEGVEFTNIGRNFIDLSRDGTKIVYTAESQIYVRHLGSFKADPVSGGSGMGTGVIGPVFSPDGQSIAFYAENALRKIPVAGGTPFTVASNVTNPHGMFWSESGIFAAQVGKGIVRVPESGGEPEIVAKVEENETAQGPQLLPDGETLVFTIHTGAADQRFDKGRIVAHSLRTGQRTVLHDGGSDGRVLPTGHLLFGNSNVLYARKLDLETLTVSGTPTPVLEGVRRAPVTGGMTYRVASTGTLLYVPGIALSSAAPRVLGFLDRAAKVSPLAIPSNTFEGPRLSPDGTRIAVFVSTDEGGDIWIQDLPVKSALRRLTFGGRNRHPVWSPDGTRIAFQSTREGDESVYVQDADVSGPSAKRLVKADAGVALLPNSWSKNGFLAVTAIKPGTAGAVHIVSPDDGKMSPFMPFVQGRSSGSATFSPDGSWLAYATVTDTAATVFVAPFPAGDAQYEIGDGNHPAWSLDGRELLVNPRSPRLALYNISTGPRFTFSIAGMLDRGQSVAPSTATRWYDFAKDGTILVVLPSAVTTTQTRDINVVLNWFEELKKVM